MAKKTQAAPKSFEEAVDELEKILAEIEGGELGLEQTLVRYERGVFLIQHCRQILSGAEQQMELIAKSADGSLETRPMDPAAGAADTENDDA